jgi:sarcosine oxidase delta subunit
MKWEHLYGCRKWHKLPLDLSHFKDTLEVLKSFEFEGTENNYLN